MSVTTQPPRFRSSFLSVAAASLAPPTSPHEFLKRHFIISGVAALFAGVSFTGVGHWWALVLMGLVQGALGFIMLAQPGVGPLALAYFFALWMISSGVLEISSAVALRSYVSNEFWWILLGIITLAFGFYVVLRPDLGVLALVYTIGFYGVFAGISLVTFGFRIKSAGADFAKLHATA